MRESDSGAIVAEGLNAYTQEVLQAVLQEKAELFPAIAANWATTTSMLRVKQAYAKADAAINMHIPYEQVVAVPPAVA